MSDQPREPGQPTPPNQGDAAPTPPQRPTHAEPSTPPAPPPEEDDAPFDPLAPPPPRPSPPSPAPAAPPLPATPSAHDTQREAFLAALYADEPDAEEDPLDAPDAGSPASPPVPVKKPDPWAHRRGEPRIFAFFWSFYVLAAVFGSIIWLTRLPVISATTYSPAARTLLVVIAAGITVLWPMTRLSQAAPERRPIAAVLADLFIVLAPVQMVVWPMIALAGWPLDIVSAVAALLAAWAALAGGVLAVAFTGRRPPGAFGRSFAMLACVALVLAAPAVLALQPLRAGGTLAWLHTCSPFTAVFAVTGSGWTGPTTGLRQWHWAGILLVLAAALGCWALALARAGAGSRPSKGLH